MFLFQRLPVFNGFPWLLNEIIRKYFGLLRYIRIRGNSCSPSFEDRTPMNWSSIHPFNQPPIQPFIHSSIHLTIHPFTNPPIHSSIRWSTRPFNRPFILRSTRSPISVYSSNHPSTQPYIHPSIHPSIHPFQGYASRNCWLRVIRRIRPILLCDSVSNHHADGSFALKQITR